MKNGLRFLGFYTFFEENVNESLWFLIDIYGKREIRSSSTQIITFTEIQILERSYKRSKHYSNYKTIKNRQKLTLT